MRELREAPFLWTSWLTRLLTGENECEWSGWFKAHYEGYTPVPSTFDAVAWRVDHTAMVSQARAHLEAEGKSVFAGELTRFLLKGSGAILGGRPDLVTISGDRGTIYDFKTGQPRPSHQVQVMIDMFAIPRAFEEWREITFDGAVVYRDHEVPVPAESVDEAFQGSLFQLITRLAAEEPARKAPSRTECAMCNIPEEECPERGTTGAPHALHEAEVDEF